MTIIQNINLIEYANIDRAQAMTEAFLVQSPKRKQKKAKQASMRIVQNIYGNISTFLLESFFDSPKFQLTFGRTPKIRHYKLTDN